MAEQTTLGLAELAGFGDRRRWAKRTIVLATVVAALMVLIWLEDTNSQFAGFASFAMVILGVVLVVSIYQGRRLNVIPTGVDRLAGAPRPITDAMIDLAVIRDELGLLLADPWAVADSPDLLLRTRDWLAGLAKLPASSREWLTRRDVNAKGIHEAFRQAVQSVNTNRSAELRLLRRAIIEFERTCGREELDFDPYRGTLRRAVGQSEVRAKALDDRVLDGKKFLARTVWWLRLSALSLFVPAALALVFMEPSWSGLISQHAAILFIPLVFAPVGMWLYVTICDWSSRVSLLRLIGASEAATRARVKRSLRLEWVTQVGLTVLVLIASVEVPIVVVERWSPSLTTSDALALLVFPTLLVIVVELATLTRAHLVRVANRARVDALERRAARSNIELPLTLLDALNARAELLWSTLPEQPDLLWTIADGLGDAAELPEELRRELVRAGFDTRPAFALLRPALARGGIMTRPELHGLRLELRSIERALARALRTPAG
jgi:hypothetical protein